jgi:hypothetical protein
MCISMAAPYVHAHLVGRTRKGQPIEGPSYRRASVPGKARDGSHRAFWAVRVYDNQVAPRQHVTG